MSTIHLGERTLDLLCDRALLGLTEAEEAELAHHLQQGFGHDDGSLDLVAARIQLAEVSSHRAGLEPMPSALRDAVVARALGSSALPPPQAAPAPQAEFSPHAGPASSAPVSVGPSSSGVVPMAGRPLPLFTQTTVRQLPQRRSRAATVVPWLAAAACLALFVGAVVYRGLDPVVRTARVVPVLPAPPSATPQPPVETPAAAREAFLASTKDAVVIPFTATDDPSAKGTTGDVVFSASTQRGFMRFVGLAANDPAQTQYQLWIFDAERDERYPVDGGVFDVGPGGEVVVPITPRVPVAKAKLFAVTVEKPGGVVVSKRERIVTTAAAAG